MEKQVPIRESTDPIFVMTLGDTTGAQLSFFNRSGRTIEVFSFFAALLCSGAGTARTLLITAYTAENIQRVAVNYSEAIPIDFDGTIFSGLNANDDITGDSLTQRLPNSLILKQDERVTITLLQGEATDAWSGIRIEGFML
jgi:hypothetical protein